MTNSSRPRLPVCVLLIVVLTLVPAFTDRAWPQTPRRPKVGRTTLKDVKLQNYGSRNTFGIEDLRPGRKKNYFLGTLQFLSAVSFSDAQQRIRMVMAPFKYIEGTPSLIQQEEMVGVKILFFDDQGVLTLPPGLDSTMAKTLSDYGAIWAAVVPPPAPAAAESSTRADLMEKLGTPLLTFPSSSRLQVPYCDGEVLFYFDYATWNGVLVSVAADGRSRGSIGLGPIYDGGVRWGGTRDEPACISSPAPSNR